VIWGMDVFVSRRSALPLVKLEASPSRMVGAGLRLMIPIAKKTGAAARSQPTPRGGSGSCRAGLCLFDRIAGASVPPESIWSRVAAAVAEKSHFFLNRCGSKFEAQKGLIFSFVYDDGFGRGLRLHRSLSLEM